MWNCVGDVDLRSAMCEMACELAEIDGRYISVRNEVCSTQL